MDCVVTLNIGDYLTENARSSFLAASRRWGADYVEVATPFRGDLNPCFTKPTIFHRLVCYERIAYFDADMLIKADAPNPLERFRDSRIYAVKDLSDVRFPQGSPVRAAVQSEAHIPWYGVMEEHFRLGVPRSHFLDKFFNAGFLICSPSQSKEVFDFVVSNIPKEGSPYAREGRYEQALTNYAVAAFGKLVLVDEVWNYISPDLSTPKMNAWVYHFTGLNSADIKPRISSFDWR